MPYNWILFTILAAFLQSVRTGLQKSLTNNLSSLTITWARFLFAAPFAVAYFFILKSTGHIQAEFNSRFYVFCFLAAISQTIGTVLLVKLFSKRNFAVGTAYSKTEAILAALIGFIIFGEEVSEVGIIAILMGLVGIFLISFKKIKETDTGLFTYKNLFTKTTLLGLVLGTFHGLTGVLVREATKSLDGGEYLINAASALLITVLIQSVILGIYIFIKEKEEIIKIKKNLFKTSMVGVTSFISSIGWFSALAQMNAGYVNAVGQIEIVFSMFMTKHIFKEHFEKNEIWGIALMISGIILLVLNS